MNNKLFFEYLDAMIAAKTDEERTVIFYGADRAYQEDKISYKNLDRLQKLVNRLAGF